MCQIPSIFHNFRPGIVNKLNLTPRYIYLVLLIFLEQFFLFFPPIECSFSRQVFNSTMFFIWSMLLGLVILRVALDMGNAPAPVPKRSKWLYPLMGGFAVISFCVHQYIIHKINYVGYSDIIPNIQILAQHCLHGKTVYALDAWKETTDGRYYPFYLPMHWLPFLVSESLHFDPRYITFFIFLFAAMVVMIRSRKCADVRMQWVVPVFSLITFLVMAKKANFVSAVTIEPMLIAFYLLFIVSVNKERFMLTGAVFVLCLLSRYYIAFWLPLWCFVMFVSGRRRYMWQTIGVTVAGVCIFFVFPFVLHNPAMLFSIGNGYDLAIISEWTKNMNKDGLPYHLFRGHGFAYLFYRHYAATDKTIGFYLLKKVLLVVPLLSTVVMGMWFYMKRKTINTRIFLMGSFKIYLTVFLSFMIVPYIYLFATSVFLSVAIFCELDRYGVVEMD